MSRWITGLGNLLIFTFFSCNGVTDNPMPSPAGIDFSRYVAVGSSFTAGFANDGLYEEGQMTAYPNLLARQFKWVEGGTFLQPIASGRGSGFLYIKGFQKAACLYVADKPDLQRYDADASWGANLADKGPFGNLGVPGMDLARMDAPDLGMENPFLARLVENPQNTSYMDLLGAARPSFFSVWMGYEDVFAHAMNGGDWNYPLTDTALFRSNLSRLLDSLQSGSATGLIANIPELSAIPFFTHTDVTVFDPVLCDGSRLPVYIEESGGKIRVSSTQDYILLPAASRIGLQDSTGIPYGLSPDNPVRHSLVLDEAEAIRVRSTLNQYNKLIEVLAESRGIAVADMKGLMAQIRSGMVADGIELSSKYLTGGIFSVDGISLTPRGNALVANRFIEAINRYYGATIPPLNVTDFDGVNFPRLQGNADSGDLPTGRLKAR
jgi:hypothetical protein